MVQSMNAEGSDCYRFGAEDCFKIGKTKTSPMSGREASPRVRRVRSRRAGNSEFFKVSAEELDFAIAGRLQVAIGIRGVASWKCSKPAADCRLPCHLSAISGGWFRPCTRLPNS